MNHEPHERRPAIVEDRRGETNLANIVRVPAGQRTRPTSGLPKSSPQEGVRSCARPSCGETTDVMTCTRAWATKCPAPLAADDKRMNSGSLHYLHCLFPCDVPAQPNFNHLLAASACDVWFGLRHGPRGRCGSPLKGRKVSSRKRADNRRGSVALFVPMQGRTGRRCAMRPRGLPICEGGRRRTHLAPFKRLRTKSACDPHTHTHRPPNSKQNTLKWKSA